MGTVDYIVSVVQYLASTETGIPRLVAYGTSQDNPFNNTLGRVVEDSRLKYVTKFITTGELFEKGNQFPVKPSLILVQGEPSVEKFRNFFLHLRDYDPSTKILILTKNFGASYAGYKLILSHLCFQNVVYLDEENTRIILTDIVSSVQLDFLAEPNKLYKKTAVRDIQGKPITYSLRSALNIR